MLEGYEHIDAALIGGLAKKLSAAPTPPADATPVDALPAADEKADWRARVRALAEKLDSQTWEAVRKEMLALAGAAG